MAFPAAAGFLACAISSIFFGSMFVPLKKYAAGDGFYVQFIMGVGIFCTGLVVGAFDGFKTFYPLAMIGGVLWATGNITAIPIINRIGMTIGILLWSFTGLLSGWISGRFGLFGMNAQKPRNETLNIIGLLLALISTVMFAFIKSTPKTVTEENSTETGSQDAQSINNNNQLTDKLLEEDELLGNDEESGPDNRPILEPAEPKRCVMYYRKQQRAFAIVASIIAGIFYGLCFVPVVYIQDNYADAPKESMSYVFAFSCGILVTCTFYFVVYSAYKCNNPVVNPRITLPAFLAGIFWAIAQTAFFVAIETLGEAVSFPIISRFPGLIAAMWGVFVFKEIEGKENLYILSAASVVTIISGIFSGFSL